MNRPNAFIVILIVKVWIYMNLLLKHIKPEVKRLPLVMLTI